MVPPPFASNSNSTLRSIAEIAGVSRSTVSMALRNHPRISHETRERVLRIAEEVGYRPDPQVSKLMMHLKARYKPQFQSVLCGVTSMPQNQFPYVEDLIASCEQRAQELGYGFTLVRIPDAKITVQNLTRQLHNRGTEGVLLLPLRSSHSLLPLLDWTRFSVVAATHGVLEPKVHRVVPDQFGNMLLLCEKLRALGYRRIGLVVPADHEVCVRYGYTAAVCRQCLFTGEKMIPPLLTDNFSGFEVVSWFQRRRPDVIVVPGFVEYTKVITRLGLGCPGKIPVAVANVEGHACLAGIDHHPEEVGIAAINLLHHLIISQQRGIPRVPMHVTIPGQWLPGPSVGSQLAK